MKENRLHNEIIHGKMIAEKGEAIWNWSSPAGIVRWERRINLFKKVIGSGNKILEIGCGTGLFTKEFLQTNNKFVAIDISPELINLAKQRISSSDIEFIIGNAYKTNFNNNSFDFIIGSSVLHHLDVKLAIKEFYRILKPSGKILFTEPNMLNPQIAIQKNIPIIKKWLGDSPDEKAFIRFILKNQLTAANFKNIKIIPFDFLHPLIPKIILKPMISITDVLEKIPILKEISGSLIISASK